MKREERMFLKLEPCGFEDCHAFERGRCVALNDTDFGERRCPFYRSRADNANEAAACMDRLARIGRKPGLETGQPDTVLGHTIHTSTYMPAITGTANDDAGKKVLLFGDMSYYWIADRTNRTLRRLNELYAVNDQVAFIGTQRVDGKLILPEAMTVLALGAKA